MSVDLNKLVEREDGVVMEVVSIEVKNATTASICVDYDEFIDEYTNYIDPKDAEINRLKAIINELKNPHTERKSRKRLIEGEWREVKELIRKGVSNTDIAAEYDISDSSVSKKRIEMRKMGEKV